MKTLSKRSKIVIASLLIFTLVLTAGWLVSTGRIAIPGVTLSNQIKSEESTPTACEQGSHISQSNSECLFVGCNGFF